MKCSECKFLWQYAPDLTSPYGEVACLKGKWDSLNFYDDLDDEIECDEYEAKSVSLRDRLNQDKSGDPI